MTTSLLPAILLVALWPAATSSSRYSAATHGKCEPISIPMCADIAYNETIFPNLMGQLTQDIAGQHMSQYVPLIKVKCSPHIHFFLCAMYAPVCTILDHAIPPCRSLCMAARHNCEDIMRQFDYSWPAEFECSKFPVGGNPEQLCVGDTTDLNVDRIEDFSKTLSNGGAIGLGGRGQLPSSPQGGKSSDFKCPVYLQMPHEYEYKLLIGTDQVIENCGAPCYHNITFFDGEQVRFSQSWVLAWSLVSLASCAFTVATFLVDRGRFPYPERPIVYLALCYGAAAAVLILGCAHGDDIACNHSVYNTTKNFLTERTIKQGSLHDWRCTVSAMVLYFFLTAGAIWWLLLTVTWFLSTGLAWGQESIDAKSQWFHTVAWTVPSILTIVVLIMKKVEGDVLSGACFVGLWDHVALLWFVIVPLAVCLALGAVLLIVGLSSLVKVRTVLKADGAKTDKLERLMWRMFVFSVLYLAPAFAFVACLVYEHVHLPKWTQMWQEDVCRDAHFKTKWQAPCRFPDGQSPSGPRPDLNLYLAKYFSLAAVGITSGFWVWCGKTIDTWKNFFTRITGGRPTQAYV